SMHGSAAPDRPVALLAVPESTPGAMTGGFEGLSSVGTAWPQLTGRATAALAMPPGIVSRDGAPIPAPCRLSSQRHGGMDGAGIVIVSDIAFAARCGPRGRWPEEAAWLRERCDAGAPICTLCTGGLLLAEAGLLDGHQATRH